jgi:urease gamma subunit
MTNETNRKAHIVKRVRAEINADLADWIAEQFRKGRTVEGVMAMMETIRAIDNSSGPIDDSAELARKNID